MTSLNGQRYFSEKIDLNARRCAPISSLIALVLGIALIDLPLTVLDLRDEINTDDYLRIMGIAQCSLKMLSFVLLLVHAGHRFWSYKCQLLSTFETNSSCHWLQIMFCSLYTAGVILHLFSHTVWRHSSDHDVELDSTGILSEISVFSFPVMLAPLLLGAVFADALCEVIWLWWALCLLSLVSVAVLTHSITYGLVVLYYFFQSGIIFYALRQNALLQLLKQQLQESQQEATLQEQDLNLKHMMANVAHDLKTPLSSFMAGVQVLTDHMDDALAQVKDAAPLRDILSYSKECLNSIGNTNLFMLMTINRCIDHTKTAKGLKLVPKCETIHVLETLSQPLRCMKDIQQRVSICMQPLPPLLCSHIIADKQWLQENLLCLLSNAVKYSAGGNVRVSVRLVSRISSEGCSDKSDKDKELDSRPCLSPTRKNKFLHWTTVLPVEQQTEQAQASQRSVTMTSMPSASFKSGKILLVEVEDSGIGLSDCAMAKLFSPFTQTQRLAGGTGLGLFSLAKRMEALQGDCGVRKRRDGQQGSLFWFSFPYNPDENAIECDQQLCSDNPSSATIATTPSSPSFKNKQRVLLVDDSPSIVKMTSMLLSKRGHEVTTASNGAEALDIVQQALECQIDDLRPAFDVILMDLQMPIMDGLEAVKRLRLLEKDHLVRHLVFGLSANSDDETQQEVRSAGFDAFLSKPFSYPLLLQLLQSSSSS